MAYYTKEQKEKYTLKVWNKLGGLETYMVMYERGHFYWRFVFKNGEEHFGCDLSKNFLIGLGVNEKYAIENSFRRRDWKEK